MNVVDRYLQAVKVFLPRASQQDIITELSDDIRSRIDDREGALGRPLTASEQETLVKGLGHPALLAGRYGPRRQLIGAELFPFYWLVLRLALGVGVVVQLGIALAMFAGGHADSALRQAVLILPLVAFVQFGVITIVFALVDFYGLMARFNVGWSPMALPRPIKQQQSVVHLIMTALVAAWWLVALREPVMIFGPHAAVVRLAPIWLALYVPILLLALADMALRVADLVRPQWSRARATAYVAIRGVSLIVLYALMRAGEWVVIVDPAGGSAAMRRVVGVFNRSFPWILAFAAIMLAATAVLRLWTLGGPRPRVIQTL